MALRLHNLVTFPPVKSMPGDSSYARMIAPHHTLGMRRNTTPSSVIRTLIQPCGCNDGMRQQLNAPLLSIYLHVAALD
jgi:hypothetical protein